MKQFKDIINENTLVSVDMMSGIRYKYVIYVKNCDHDFKYYFYPEELVRCVNDEREIGDLDYRNNVDEEGRIFIKFSDLPHRVIILLASDDENLQNLGYSIFNSLCNKEIVYGE